MTLVGGTVSQNLSGGDGGGIMNTGTLTITRTTISGNEADASGEGDGGGLMYESDMARSHVLVVDTTTNGLPDTYYVRITNGSVSEYSLVVTRDADFDTVIAVYEL